MNRTLLLRLIISTLASGTIAVGAAAVADAEWDAPARYALDFNGHSTYVEVPHSSDLNSDGPFTLEAWVMARDYQESAPITGAPDNDMLAKWDDAGGGFTFMLVDGFPAVDVGYSPSSYLRVMSSTRVERGRYHHVAATWDGAHVRIFLDGVTEGIGALDHIRVSQSGPLTMGYPYWWNGLCAEVRISSICRYTSDFVPPHTFEADADTRALWLLDDVSSSVVVDASLNGHDGVVSNGSWVHSIQPIYLDTTADCLDVTSGTFAGGRSPWAVHLLPSISYRMTVSGEAFLVPGDPAESFVLHAATPSAETTILVPSDNDDSFPLENADGLDFAMFFVDSYTSDNSGALRVEIVPADPAAAPDPPTPTESSATLPRLLLRPNPASTSVSMGLTYMTDRQGAEFEVFAMDGRLVRRIPSASGATEWDLLDSEGHRVAAGRYIVRAETSKGFDAEAIVVID